MDVFHCNLCYVFVKNARNRKFFLTSCGHLLCSHCQQSSGADKCKVCGEVCKFLELSNNMPEDMKIYFSDLGNECKKFVKNLCIQLKHCKIYMEEYVPQLEKKYLTSKAIIEKQNRQIQTMSAEMSKLKADLAHMKGLINLPRTSPALKSQTHQRQETEPNRTFSKRDLLGSGYKSSSLFFTLPPGTPSCSKTGSLNMKQSRNTPSTSQMFMPSTKIDTPAGSKASSNKFSTPSTSVFKGNQKAAFGGFRKDW